MTGVRDVRLRARDGTGLATRWWGAEARFLLVHGLASNARLWDGVGAELAARGTGAVAVDQRGHGRSDKPGVGFDFATLAEDLATVVGDHGPVVAAGQSWGGNVVLELAARHPELVRGVVCVDGGFIRLADAFPTEDAMLVALSPPRFDGLDRATLEAGLRARLAGWPESAVHGQLANFTFGDDGSVRAHLSRDDHHTILGHLWRHDPDALADRVSVPILVLAVPGGQLSDKEARVAAFAASHPRAEVRWVEGEHDIHAQHPDLVAEALVRFEAGL